MVGGKDVPERHRHAASIGPIMKGIRLYHVSKHHVLPLMQISGVYNNAKQIKMKGRTIESMSE